VPRGFTKWHVWQYIGDWSAPGFNAGIDVNRAKLNWYLKYIEPQDDTVAEKLHQIASDLIDLADRVTRCANECNDNA